MYIHDFFSELMKIIRTYSMEAHSALQEKLKANRVTDKRLIKYML